MLFSLSSQHRNIYDYHGNNIIHDVALLLSKLNKKLFLEEKLRSYERARMMWATCFSWCLKANRVFHEKLCQTIIITDWTNNVRSYENINICRCSLKYFILCFQSQSHNWTIAKGIEVISFLFIICDDRFLVMDIRRCLIAFFCFCSLFKRHFLLFSWWISFHFFLLQVKSRPNDTNRKWEFSSCMVGSMQIFIAALFHCRA